ncbi:hypothetical protein [Magnetovibrio blakemorei]|uniref:Uncharacterized protein n=1 Tax=Magnetovibrio blakemorei TaxID=28181 RepID=A0A1E5Q4P6_9PROT|nr:hypothetical protein [Magnetovibrio blakemorei]OEJ65205.1 hypothetical protein BEN30_15140 [Magnetovibrio blakemorei]
MAIASVESKLILDELDHIQMMPIKMPWKKGFRKIPPTIKRKVETLGADAVIVAAVKKVKHEDVNKGIYDHLSFTVEDDKLKYPERIMPQENVGHTSKVNVNGKEIVRKDLPMTTKTFSFDTPNFGDAATYGTHTVDIVRDVYQRDHIAPRDNTIKIETIEELDGATVVAFTVEETFDLSDPNLEGDLLFNLNLIQENTGVSDIFGSAASLEDFKSAIVVEWEILPPDTREDNLTKILGKVKNPILVKTISDRYGALEKLKPRQIIRGTSGFNRYFGAMFEDDLVAFENLEYGNALYVMYENWPTLSQKTRLELRKSDGGGYERIEHRADWEKTLARVVNQKRDE